MEKGDRGGRPGVFGLGLLEALNLPLSLFGARRANSRGSSEPSLWDLPQSSSTPSLDRRGCAPRRA